MISLETQRLLLRMWKTSDFESYAELCSNAEVMRFIGDGKPLNRDEAWRHMAMIIRHWHLCGYGMWAVEEKATGNFIGRIGFFNPEGWPGFELGWVLRKKYWKKGYATEGANKALEYIFTETSRDHVISLISCNNQASINVATRIGEKIAGTIEFNGKKLQVYKINRTDWQHTFAVSDSGQRAAPF